MKVYVPPEVAHLDLTSCHSVFPYRGPSWIISKMRELVPGFLPEFGIPSIPNFPETMALHHVSSSFFLCPYGGAQLVLIETNQLRERSVTGIFEALEFGPGFRCVSYPAPPNFRTLDLSHYFRISEPQTPPSTWVEICFPSLPE